MFNLTKSEKFQILLFLIGIFGFGAAIFWYDSSAFAIRDYNAICPQNFGDPISLSRCFIPYHMQFAFGRVGLVVSGVLATASVIAFIILRFKKK